jgi:hypothetical protein
MYHEYGHAYLLGHQIGHETVHQEKRTSTAPRSTRCGRRFLGSTRTEYEERRLHLERLT